VKNRWIGAAVIVASLVVLGLQTFVVGGTGFLMGDFRAFYCGARVASQGADPYHAEPLRSCEISLGRTAFFEKNPHVAIPAPLPGYVLAAFAPLALLPFAAATALWAAILLMAWIACVATLARFASVPWDVAFALFAVSLGTLSLPFGEVVPVALACICLAAYFAWRGRWLSASLSATGAMIEPHLALPVWLSLAIWVPRTRAPLALAACALGAISLAFLGAPTNLEYFTSVLPAHALSEIARDTQYSLTAVLSSLGLADGPAVRAGTAWYLAMLAAGAFVAGRLAKKIGNNAALVCVPPAFAIFGGAFIHITQIPAALPAAALFVNHVTGERRTLAVVAILLLAVPWGWVLSISLIFAPFFPVGFLAYRYWGGNLRAILFAATAAAALSATLIFLPRPAPHVVPHSAAPTIDNRLAESTWSTFTRSTPTFGPVAAWVVRIPTWAGLLVLLLLLTREAGAVRLPGSRSIRYSPSEAP
jgi:Glycosyltransferase family 87